MIGGDLFRRFALRFGVGLGLAFLVFVPLVHVFQLRIVSGEWREDLRQEARWFAAHALPERLETLTDAWRTMHATVRVSFFDADGLPLADSHPERPLPDLSALREGRVPRSTLAAVEEVRNGGWLVMSRPALPGFPHGLQWELVLAALFVAGLVPLLLYPLVRSMSRTLGQLGALAGQVSSGQFGRTLAVAPAEEQGELGELVRAFNRMSLALAEAERLNTRLLHDVSHELRSPLGRIQVLAETIALRPAEAEDCIRGIRQEVELLDRLVGDLLQAARIEADARAREPESFPLLEWGRETLARLESEARARGVGWTARLPAEERAVRGDPQRLAQALGNLVDNALHALEGRAEGHVEVAVSVGAEAWSVSVRDDGPGIPGEDLPHVFRRFYRVGDDRSREGGGVGLGLSLVRAIAEAHGGEASIESRPGAGTTVTLRLPLG